MHRIRSTGWYVALVIALTITVLPGCGRENGARQNVSGRTFAVSFQTMNNPFFVELNQGLLDVIEAHGDRLITMDAQFGDQKQMNDLSDAVLQQVAGLFINPVNWEGIRGSLLVAKGKHIPCIIVDAPAKDEDLVVCTVASDNVEAGRLACRALAGVNPQAKVVILHRSVNKACIDRVDGFMEEMQKHPEMKLLDTQEGMGTAEGGRPVTRDVLARYPEVDALFPINDPSALGALSAIEAAGKRGQITVVTVDGSAEGAAAIKEGKLYSSSAQFPREIGRTAAESMYAYLAGRPVEKNIKVRVELVTKDNADRFLAQGSERGG